MFAGAKQSLLNKLDVVQNSALRSCLGCIKTTPLNVLHHVAGIPTLRNRRLYLAKRFILSFSANMDSLISPKLQYIFEFCKRSNTNHKISKFGLLYNAWVDSFTIRTNIIRSPKLPTFYVHIEVFFWAI